MWKTRSACDDRRSDAEQLGGGADDRVIDADFAVECELGALPELRTVGGRGADADEVAA